MATDAARRFERNKTMPHFVYAICETNTDFAPRYVGCTVDVANRMDMHRHTACNGDLWQWFKANDWTFKVAILESCDGFDSGREAERWWIRHLADQGHDIFNISGKSDCEWQKHLSKIRNEAARRIRRMFQKARLDAGCARGAGRILSHGERSMPLPAWAYEIGISPEQLILRIQRLGIEKSLSLPLGAGLHYKTRTVLPTDVAAEAPA